MQHLRLKRFARTCIATLRPMFPVQDIKDKLDDPERIGLIFPDNEWMFESPSDEWSAREKQDWVMFHGCSPETKSRLVVFLERINGQVAVIWLCLQIRGGSILVQKEICHMDQSHGHVFVAGGLRLEVAAPMRHWRVAFNGLLIEADSGNEVHVRMAARFVSLSHPAEFPRDFAPSKFARRFEQTAQGKSVNEIKADMRKATGFEGYEQAGTFYCEIHLNGERTEEILWGSKVRYVGTSPLFTKCNHHFGYAANGAVFHIIESEYKKTHGFCYTPSTFMKRLTDGRFVKEDNSINLTFNVEPLKFKGVWKDFEELAIGNYSATPDSSWRVRTAWGNLKQTNMSGENFLSGILSVRFSEEYEIPEAVLDKYTLTKLPSVAPNTSPRIVSTDDPLCKYPTLTGGKGSSLAHLTLISKEIQKFIVPRALVLTVAAYDEFISEPSVAAAVNKLVDRCSHPDIDLTGIRTASEDCVKRLSSATLPRGLREELQRRLISHFGSVEGSRDFAIRSSAVGEDSEEMSAAGQLNTSLCVRGMRNIETAVVNCWASQFTFRALNYKLQYGQELAGSVGMAVVIQEMVHADCAGVMFTCDPISGNPARLMITANFGLGESVVSSTVDPDTFTMIRAAVPGGLTRFSIESRRLGKKERAVVPHPEGGTEEREMKGQEAESSCIDESKLLEIADIGSQVEEYCDAPRDIEWAVSDGKIYLLQSRPISSLFKESDFEITHDMNTGLPTNREILSRSNLDEVMPGALTPITLDAYSVLFDLFSTRFLRSRAPELYDWSLYAPRSQCRIGKKMYMNFSPNLLGSGRTSLDQQVLMTYGTDVKNHEIYTRGIFHPSVTPRNYKTKAARHSFKFMTSTDEILRKGKVIAENFTIDLPESGSARDLVKTFASQLHRMKNALPYLMAASIASQNWHLAAVNVLKSALGSKVSDAEVMSIFSKLARSDLEVESADIPSNLQDLAARIKDSPLGEHFESLDPKEALKKLQADDGEVGKHFNAFMERHGTRCYKEFDFYSRPWIMDPLPLIRSLQSYASTANASAKANRIRLEDLEHRPGFIRKGILKMLLSRAQMAVYTREAMKAAVVKCAHEVRIALWTIGKQLERENRVPEAELIFFLTVDEAYRLAKDRDPNLVSRASRRRRIHPKLNKQTFDTLVCGFPRPITEVPQEVDVNATCVKGTPVSEGFTIGVARVIHDFETEAHLIKRDEILITHATDTGWTPYFPLLSGVITEIGGLLSHGAVVAREYGLPAIVGVVNATHIFQSGDVVRVDAGTGTVSKLEGDPVKDRVNAQEPVGEKPDPDPQEAGPSVQKAESQEDVRNQNRPSIKGYSLLSEDDKRSLQDDELLAETLTQLECAAEDVEDALNIFQTWGEGVNAQPKPPRKLHMSSTKETAIYSTFENGEHDPLMDSTLENLARPIRTITTHTQRISEWFFEGMQESSNAEQHELDSTIEVTKEPTLDGRQSFEELQTNSQQEQVNVNNSSNTETEPNIETAESELPQEDTPDAPMKLRRGAAFKRKSSKSTVKTATPIIQQI